MGTATFDVTELERIDSTAQVASFVVHLAKVVWLEGLELSGPQEVIQQLNAQLSRNPFGELEMRGGATPELDDYTDYLKRRLDETAGGRDWKALPEALWAIQELEEQVRAEINSNRPDEIAGLQISYLNQVPTAQWNSDDLRALPAETLRLPDGTVVQLSISFQGELLGPDTDHAALRQQVRERHLAQKEEELSRPADVPDFEALVAGAVSFADFLANKLPGKKQESLGPDPLGGKEVSVWGAWVLEDAHPCWKWFRGKQEATSRRRAFAEHLWPN